MTGGTGKVFLARRRASSVGAGDPVRRVDALEVEPAMTSPVPPAELLRVERAAFIETLGTLSDGQWQQSSLCDDWRVVDVAAHLAWAPVLGPAAGAVALLRSRGSVNGMIARTAIGWSSRGRDAILDQLAANRDSGATPIGMPTVAALADAVVHGADVRRPLGLHRPVPAAVLDPIASFVLRTPWPLNGVVGGNAARRIAGVRLVADDSDWTYGDGPEVLASGETLALILYGRQVEDADLSGDGANVIRARR